MAILLDKLGTKTKMMFRRKTGRKSRKHIYSDFFIELTNTDILADQSKRVEPLVFNRLACGLFFFPTDLYLL